VDKVTKIGVWLLWALAFTALAIGCGDITPPTTPKNLLVNATSSTTIDVSWDASESKIEIEGYRVYRGGVFNTMTNATSFQDSGLTNATEYCYRVQAVDTDGNRSDKTDEECDTTFANDDTQNPTAPVLSLTVVNSTRIDLAWTNSTDDTGIDHYDIYRNSSLLNSQISNTYSDVGLTPLFNYCYFVRAVDLANKQSNSSNQECGITNSTGP